MVLPGQGYGGAVSLGLDAGPPAEATVQQRTQVPDDRLAADDEHPGVRDGVEGVEAEGGQVLVVAAKRVDGVDEAGDLKRRE